MSRGLMYWIIVLIWIVLVLASFFGYGGAHTAMASEGVLLLLFVLLGWQVYGPPIHG